MATIGIKNIKPKQNNPLQPGCSSSNHIEEHSAAEREKMIIDLAKYLGFRIARLSFSLFLRGTRFPRHRFLKFHRESTKKWSSARPLSSPTCSLSLKRMFHFAGRRRQRPSRTAMWIEKDLPMTSESLDVTREAMRGPAGPWIKATGKDVVPREA